MGRLNPYTPDPPFVGRTHELKEVTGYLRQGQSVLLVGGRRCGKTRLVREIADIGRAVVQLDAGGWSLGSEAEAIESIGAQLGASCATREGLRRSLKAKLPLAVVVDEADRILRRPWAGGFLSYLRWLDGTDMRAQIAFVLTGGPSLITYQNPADGGSPPMNIAVRVYLEPLDYSARRRLLSFLGANGAPPFPDRGGSRPRARAPRGPAGRPDRESVIFDAAGGHPWLLKSLLARLWDGRNIDDALESVFADALTHLGVWKSQLGEEGQAFVKAIPPSGVLRSTVRKDPHWARHRAAAVLTRSLCLVDLSEDGETLLPRPRIFHDWLAGRRVPSPASRKVRSAKRLVSRQGRTPPFRVFISYSWTNSAERLALSAKLNEMPGVKVLVDREAIPPAAALHPAISQLIDEANCVVVLLTNEGLSSREVRDELVRCDERRKLIIPIVASGTKLEDLPSYLRDTVHIKYVRNDFDSVVKAVVERIRGLASG